MTRRVVVTGMSGISPLGSNWKQVRAKLKGMVSGISVNPDWESVGGLQSQLVGRAEFAPPDHWERQKTRTMGRVAEMAAWTTETALKDAKLLDHSALTDGSCGVAYGSTAGSPPAIEEYFQRIAMDRNLKGLSPTVYIQLMSHTAAANLVQFFKIKGRLIPTCSACTSGSQGIGFGYEAIRHGQQNIMITGGAEELHLAELVVFDVMYATSKQNSNPHLTPRPFDKDRDGLVIGEGAGTLILEELNHAEKRGAPIYAEIVGFGTNTDGAHITNPSPDGMEACMRLALQDANLSPTAIQYINGHGTATEVGDIAEAKATSRVYGNNIPFSSLKSYMGHTLGACGALEAWMTIHMAREGWFAPTINLKNVDERCESLDYIKDKPREMEAEYFVSNNFAFGGVNTSLVFKRYNPNRVNN